MRLVVAKERQDSQCVEWRHVDVDESTEFNTSNRCIRFIEMCGLDLKKIGTKEFIQRIEEYVQNYGMNELTGKLDIPISTLNIIVEGLKQPLQFDIRSKNNVPIFKSEICSYNDVKIGSTLTGQVKNVTTFAAFVDCGLEVDGFIPAKYINTINICVGDRVEVKSQLGLCEYSYSELQAELVA
uniref:S1 motif domain-containing protein n=1 Tax=Timema tahoe TaxID=61484 RepID=A0A7R9NV27_9NEOP|nr:unnamed protein product [Timema tahoe]